MSETPSAENYHGTACGKALWALLDAMRDAPGALNEKMPFSNRMQVEKVEVGEVTSQAESHCSAPVTLHIDGAARTCKIECILEGSRSIIRVRGEAGYEEEFELGQIGVSPTEEEERLLRQVLANAVAAHLGTGS